MQQVVKAVDEQGQQGSKASTYSDPRALTRSSASADGPRDALCQSKSCQLTAPQFYHPRDATLALCLSVCVCHKSVFCRNGWTNRAGFWQGSFLPPIIHREVILRTCMCDACLFCLLLFCESFPLQPFFSSSGLTT